LRSRTRSNAGKYAPRAAAALSARGLELRTHRAGLLLALATILLKSTIFAPISWWPLAFVCLVPWLLLVGTAERAPRVYAYSFLMALAFFLLNMRWLYPATGYGYAALSVYQALYFPLMACPLRHAVRRRRWPLALVVPLVLVGSELLRAVAASGFPWFFLSHSLYKVLPLIQVSDLVGAHGVSFVVAAVNGATADLILVRKARPRDSGAVPSPRSARFGAAFAGGLLVLSAVYGFVQLSRDTTSPGPKIAVFQGDFLNTVYHDDSPEEEQLTEEEKMQFYLSMMGEAAAHKPDLYLLPESPWYMYLNPEARSLYPLSRVSFERLQRHATEHDAYVVTGSGSLIRTPLDFLAKFRAYNSATVFRPDGSEPGRYDKIHLVYFGEVVPFRFGKLRFLYFWLNSLMPFSGPDGEVEYSIFRGKEFRAFTMQAASVPGTTFKFGVPICYEDVMPYVSREFVCGGRPRKRVDLLLNISNDGWFGRGVQQPQHLAICVFRAVENRVGIARAVNTGVSGFIESSGRLHDLVGGNGTEESGGNSGYAVADVGVDSRYTLYSRYGDWFGWGCALAWLALFVDYGVARARAPREE